jgi:hypothetical protein
MRNFADSLLKIEVTIGLKNIKKAFPNKNIHGIKINKR